jgi:uncharacterized membrane protein YphA (DoxX/SURF4 family)
MDITNIFLLHCQFKTIASNVIVTNIVVTKLLLLTLLLRMSSLMLMTILLVTVALGLSNEIANYYFKNDNIINRNNVVVANVVVVSVAIDKRLFSKWTRSWCLNSLLAYRRHYYVGQRSTRGYDRVTTL